MGPCLFNKGVYNLINSEYFKTNFYSHPNATSGTQF